MGSDGSSQMLIKQLASCNKSIRDRAVKLLLSWLPQNPQISEEDLKKVWKGLFYCMWHSDKAPVQAELIDRLSSLLLSLDRPLALQYVSIFFLTMHREWSGIDSLRLDKFYLFIRRFLHHCFIYLSRGSWNLGLLSELMGVLEGRTFLSEGKFPSNGVNYHVASVFLEEIEPFLPVSEKALSLILQPFISLIGRSMNRVLVSKAKLGMFDVLAKMGRKLLEANIYGGDFDGNSQVVTFGTIALTIKLSNKFFELGSSLECVQGNRKVLFGLYENFNKLEKDLDSSGIIISTPNFAPVDLYLENVSEVAREEYFGTVTKREKHKKAKRVKREFDVSEKTVKIKMIDTSDRVIDSGEEVKVNDVVDNIVLANLQIQFEKVAAEASMDKIIPSVIVHKKRKRDKSLGEKDFKNSGTISEGCMVGENSDIKSAKRVRFSMKNNLIWKPHNPLPPESLRIPPTVAPRGSALKKGVPPGPIREIPGFGRIRAKVKTGRKAVKRLKKIKAISP